MTNSPRRPVTARLVAIALVVLVCGLLSACGGTVRNPNLLHNELMRAPDTTTSSGAYKGGTDYRIGAQDLLEITVFGLKDFDREVLPVAMVWRRQKERSIRTQSYFCDVHQHAGGVQMLDHFERRERLAGQAGQRLDEEVDAPVRRDHHRHRRPRRTLDRRHAAPPARNQAALEL